MSDLISNEELTSQLSMVIPKCYEINIISAFITKSAINWLKQLIADSSPKVLLVGRFSPRDFLSGASDFEALTDSLTCGYKVKCLSNLHAKIYQIDEDIIYTGSANLTGKGLALVQEGNLESCSKIEPSDTSKEFIKKISDSAINITPGMILKMKLFLELLKADELNSIVDVWPVDIMPKTLGLFVSDFPLGAPGETHYSYMTNPSLEFSIIENNRENTKAAIKLFKNSKVYLWLKKLLMDNTSQRDLGFGQISSLLHDELADDPAPYRKGVKEIQSNLYEYIKLYASDEISVYVPGKRSQVLKLNYG